MKDTTTVIKIIPAEVHQDDFEELLITDRLFIDYFNAFLRLPTFPEPLFYNKDSTGFELVTEAKQEVVNEIKRAVRSARERNKIYQPVHNHSFSPLPLIPIVANRCSLADRAKKGKNEKEIDTSFPVKTLNKEQGIQWVKRERLPLFLESDLYSEYRLAKLISQVKASTDPDEHVSIELDYSPHEQKQDGEEEEKPEGECEAEKLMRTMYVTMGQTCPTDTDAWVSQVKVISKGTDTVTTNAMKTLSTVVEQDSSKHVKLTMAGPSNNCRDCRALSINKNKEEHEKWSVDKLYAVAESPEEDITQYSSNAIQSKGQKKELDQQPLLDTPSKIQLLTLRPSFNLCTIASPKDKLGDPAYSVPKSAHLSANLLGYGLEQDITGEDMSAISVNSVRYKHKCSDAPVKNAKGDVQEISSNTSAENAKGDVKEMSSNTSAENAEGDVKEMSSYTSATNAEEDVKEISSNTSAKSTKDVKEISSNTSAKNTEGVKEMSSNTSAKNAEEGVKEMSSNTSAKNAEEGVKEMSSNTSAKNTEQGVKEMSSNTSAKNAEDDVKEMSSNTSAKSAKDDIENLSNASVKSVKGSSIDLGNDVSVESVKSSEDCEEMYDRNKIYQSLEELSGAIVSSAMKSAVLEVGQKPINLMALLPGCNDFFARAEKFEGRIVRGTVYVKEMETDVLKGVRSVAMMQEDKDSDEDSALNSDDDYEESMDDFFRSKKTKEHTLKNMKGVEAFKKFLAGSNGEKNWSFWLDVERAKLLCKDKPALNKFLLAMREHYLKPGGDLELPSAIKVKMKLNEPSQWTLEKLVELQNSMAEPLLLYWAPRFLIKQKVKIQPDANMVYHQQQTLKPKEEPHPNPVVATTYPLRPKKCMPRDKNMKNNPRQCCEVSYAFDYLKNTPQFESQDNKKTPPTTPLVGNKRQYCLPEQFQTRQMKKDAPKPKAKVRPKTPRKLITAKLKASNDRPTSAPAKMKERKNSTAEKDERVPSDWDKDSPQRVRHTSISSGVSTDSGISEFTGGRRMEGLLQALHNERNSGAPFRKYLLEAKNNLWNSCLDFWEGLQEYHKLFYIEVLDTWLLKQKARYLYAMHFAASGSKKICCDHVITDAIHSKLYPPFEELFDEAEEYVLNVLFDAWSEAISSDLGTFGKIELVEIKRHIDAKSKYLEALQKKGMLKEREASPEPPDGDNTDYNEFLWKRVAEEFREWDLEKLVRNRVELEAFKEYLAENYASMDLMCWIDIETYRRIPHADENGRYLKGKSIKMKYLNKKYFFGPHSPADKDSQVQVVQDAGGWGKLLADRPPITLILDVQKYVRDRLQKNWLPRFLSTREFEERQRLRVHMDEAVENVLIQKKKKSQAIWRMLESKWISSTKDIIAFRKALINPVTSKHFQKYVALKGDNLENDVIFYREVQKYKDICHAHAERSLMQQKTQTIINCFIESVIPPPLQIDIPQEMADRLVERKMEATPYLFREAQLTVFRVLFLYWNEFGTFRSHLTDEALASTLDRHRRRKQEEEKLRREQEEEKTRQLNAVRRRLTGDPEGFDEMDSTDRGEAVDDIEVPASWSYSQYANAFDRESVLNTNDPSTLLAKSAEDKAQEAARKQSAERKMDLLTQEGDVTGTPKPSPADSKQELPGENNNNSRQRRSRNKNRNNKVNASQAPRIISKVLD